MVANPHAAGRYDRFFGIFLDIISLLRRPVAAFCVSSILCLTAARPTEFTRIRAAAFP